MKAEEREISRKQNSKADFRLCAPNLRGKPGNIACRKSQVGSSISRLRFIIEGVEP